MAEALAIVGALAACLQLAKGFSELGKSIVAASQGIRYVPEYISELKDSAELFTISLRKLVRAAKKAYSDNKESTEARETAKAMDIIRSQGRKLKPKIYDLVRQVEGRLFSSTFSQLFSKLRVLFKQTGVQSLQNSLHRLMHTTHLLGSGIILDTLLARIKKLEDEDIPVSEDLRDEV
ncbi:hypothetical protein P152DRAFT_477796 [Eremomyces bilateralis CBS 781.70]|uniref:NACHT-NTPase and P-loop NTPases N-terminal domain-containing protein n=1 Tax=Eremomyces bilateralis CBS 781.70 TaxID=1392243 RepID=A0A6G1FQC4_9PEZI|nr:uncharacterized protein P152DRAFT_477796 [Eremomyces bilateralis CBS 781.70]KAF1807889.1 hypothetical protein P152DRAFT_477796 [Eremomyces bilateralis CBS 781.70]